MCGIVFVSRKNGERANKMVKKRFNDQRGRGVQGFGYVGLDKDYKVISYERGETEKYIEDALEDEKASTILFHHRMPTSTPNITEASHPILVSSELLDFDYYVVHNGIITNDDELKAEHEKLGFQYQTEITKQILTRKGDVRRLYTVFNDSEALAHELALVLDGEKKDIKIKGSVAFIVLKVRKKDKQCVSVHYGRNYSNPLKTVEDKEEYWTLCSEGEGTQIRANEIHTFNFLTQKYSAEVKEIGEATVNYDRHLYPASTTPVGNTTPMGFDTTKTRPMRGAWDMEQEKKNLPIQYLPEGTPAEEEDDTSKTTYEEYLKDLYSEEDSLRQQLTIAEINQDIDTFCKLQEELDDCIKVQKEVEEKYLNEANADEMAEIYADVIKDVDKTYYDRD